MVKSNPKISIVTITYNNVSELKRTLASVVSQSLKGVEWIVVDGNSIDGTAELLKRNSHHISRIIRATPRGPYDAMNRGAEFATGELICFINSGDELFSSDTLSQVWNYYTSNNKPDVIYGDALIISGSKQYMQYNPNQLTLKYLLKSMINHQAIYCRLSTHKVIGEFNTKFKVCADYDWLLKAVSSSCLTFEHFAHPVAKFHLGGLSSQVDPMPERAKIQAQYFGVPQTYLREIRRKNISRYSRLIYLIKLAASGDIRTIVSKIKKKWAR